MQKPAAQSTSLQVGQNHHWEDILKHWQKNESEKNYMFDKKEMIYSHEVENLKLHFIEEKEQLKESVNDISKERE